MARGRVVMLKPGAKSKRRPTTLAGAIGRSGSSGPNQSVRSTPLSRSIPPAGAAADAGRPPTRRPPDGLLLATISVPSSGKGQPAVPELIDAVQGDEPPVSCIAATPVTRMRWPGSSDVPVAVKL